MRKKTQRTKDKRQSLLTFWEAIRALRLAKGLTQAELAEAVSDNADAPWISRVEAGKKDISLRTALRIVQALGVDMRVAEYEITEDI